MPGDLNYISEISRSKCGTGGKRRSAYLNLAAVNAALEVIMITGSILREKDYGYLTARIHKAVRYLKDHNLCAMEDGTYEIDGEEIYMMLQSFRVENPIDAAFETHRKYIDIQYVLKGELELLIEDRSGLTPTGRYDTEQDVQFYEPRENAAHVRLSEGEMAILFPEDAHKMICFPQNGETVRIRKAVVKVRA